MTHVLAVFTARLSQCRTHWTTIKRHRTSQVPVTRVAAQHFSKLETSPQARISALAPQVFLLAAVCRQDIRVQSETPNVQQSHVHARTVRAHALIAITNDPHCPTQHFGDSRASPTKEPTCSCSSNRVQMRRQLIRNAARTPAISENRSTPITA